MAVEEKSPQICEVIDFIPQVKTYRIDFTI